MGASSTALPEADISIRSDSSSIAASSSSSSSSLPIVESQAPQLTHPPLNSSVRNFIQSARSFNSFIKNLRSPQEILNTVTENKSSVIASEPAKPKHYGLPDADMISQYTREEFIEFLAKIAYDPAKIHSEYYERGCWLDECWCENTGAHARGFFVDLRKDYEKEILASIKNKNKHQAITIFSGGSGKLLQELILLIKLILAGYSQVQLDCLEIKDYPEQQIILNAIIAQINKYFGASYKVNHFKTIDDITAQNNKYDVVYWIDFEPIGTILCSDFSNRQLPGRVASENNINTLKALLWSLSKVSHKGLFLLSYGKNKILLKQNCYDYNFDETRPFSESLKQQVYHDYYFIQSNPFVILFNLPYLKRNNKPIFINTEIVDEQLYQILNRICSNYEITIIYRSFDELRKILIHKNKTVLILDDTVFDSRKEESAIESIPDDILAQTSRLDWVKQTKWYSTTKKIKLYPDFGEIKEKQFAQAFSQLNHDELFDKIRLGINNYLKWRNENTQGTLGLTRFNHWHHGSSGINRARELRLYIDRLSNKELNQEQFSDFKENFYTLCQQSSSTKHSLSRFIYSAVIDDSNHQIQQLNQTSFKQIRQGINI